MTPLRHRMMQDLQLRGDSDRTVEAYPRAVRQLAQFYHASPDTRTEAQVRQYLIRLTTVHQVARGTHTIALGGIKCFYEQTLERQWTGLDVARPQGEQKLPVVLSRDEVWRALGALRLPVYRACLTTIYACGLRLTEGIRLQVPDIDGESPRRDTRGTPESIDRVAGGRSRQETGSDHTDGCRQNPCPA